MGTLSLLIVEGPESGRSVPLTGPLVVGRGQQAHLVLVDPLVSLRHAQLTPADGGVVVADLGSTNGTFVNGQQISAPVRLRAGDHVAFGATLARLEAATPSLVPTVATTAGADLPTAFTDRRAAPVVGASVTETVLSGSDLPGDLTEELLTSSVWSDEQVAAAGIPVVDAPFVTVGGGMGSFVMIDVLRIAGMTPEQLKVLTLLDFPWQTYQYLTSVSQIPLDERIRSDSASTPDNIWGFPSYAVREAFGARSVRGFVGPLWNVLAEPVLADYWTPTAGQVFHSLQREAGRIGYWRSVARGQVRLVRKRQAGGYFTVLTPPLGSVPTRRVAYRSKYVHLAVGYPGLRFLPDLQRYRDRYGDRHRLANAYEPHEHVYEELARRGGRVLVRGGGIVASRVLQRLMDDRERYGCDTQILHLFRTYVTGRHGPSPFMRRRGGDGWAYQGFNWPKATWGGQLRERLASLEGEERAELLRVMGGTNTPYRKKWQRQLKRGRREGFYRTMVGEIAELRPGDAGGLRARVTAAGREDAEVAADFLIDATGLEAELTEHGSSATCSSTRAPAATRWAGSTSSGPSRCAARAAAPAACTPPARPPSAATTRASTPSSACSTPHWPSPTTWPRRGWCAGSARAGRCRSGGGG